jgi:hypothetical protein
LTSSQYIEMASSLESNQTIDPTIFTTNYDIDPTLRFWLFLVFDILALVCSSFVLYHLLSQRRSREALRNHATILMLLFAFIYQSVDIPLHLSFLHTGLVHPATRPLCLIWWYIDWCFYFVIVMLLAFISFERHILIFHSHLLATQRKRWIFHYIPLITSTSFIILFYVIAIFSPVCRNIFDYTVDLCGMYACYALIPFFFLTEQVGFGAIPCFLIVVFNLTLLMRVIWQKHHLHQSGQWKKQRKLAIQVFLMSSLYLVFAFPLTLIYFVRLWHLPTWGSEMLPIYFFLSYFVILLLPFVCLVSLPNLSIRAHRTHPRSS